MNKTHWLLILIILSVTCPISYAQSSDDDGIGQVIQINTRFHSFIGKPRWTLIIRDLDHNENIPYLYDITRGTNHWIALTYGRNYLITASNIIFETYRSKYNTYRQFKTNNFCHLESKGRISRGESMFIQIEGDLSPDTSTYRCHVTKYTGDFSNFQNFNPEN